MSGTTGTILVVEDIPNVLELFKVTLRFKGYQVVTATNGEEALRRIAEKPPALIITDILMPKMDGFSLVQSLRTNPLTSRIPVIFVSATYLTPEDKKFALSLGGARFIEKPIDTEDFLLTVAEVLTADIATLPKPMPQADFNRGYSERLEEKLRHKNTQIMRIERLLPTLPPEQRPGFQTMLENAIRDRDDIQVELNKLDHARTKTAGNGDDL
ncbi:MAG: response regulator [Anaerolineae bacterium]|nr:response regulator [Anaerolineae bacterium]